MSSRRKRQPVHQLARRAQHLGAHRRRHHGDLRGQRIGPAHPVDLARVRRAHDAEQQRVAQSGLARQV